MISESQMSPPGILFNVRHYDFKKLWPWMLLFFFKEAFLYSVSQNGIRWVQSNQDWADVRCSGALYKAWFTHRLNINSTLTPRDSRWSLLCTPSPLDRFWNPTFVSQGSWDCWKFHTVFQCFLPSFLGFDLHSLSFEKIREKWRFKQCWIITITLQVQTTFTWANGCSETSRVRTAQKKEAEECKVSAHEWWNINTIP